VAACVGVSADAIVLRHHAPVWASVGNPYVIAEVTRSALATADPDLNAFRRAVARRPEWNGRYSLHLYARDGAMLRARMFAPLAGTFEDPATGSANAPLGGLLLSLSGEARGDYTILQGVEMGRPSTLHVTAWREQQAIHTAIRGLCVPVLRGVAHV
jgi:trans-2,3-dihydro-3-hydroxyanthranilate isomerase